MKIHVISDVHFDRMGATRQIGWWEEFDRTTGKSRSPEVLIIPGDLGEIGRDFDQLGESLEKFCDRYPLVVYTPGNHEYWGTSIQAGNEVLAQWKAPSNLHILSPDNPVTVNGQRIIGGTMWYPDSKEAFKYSFPDYRFIRDLEPAVYQEHEKFVNMLSTTLTKDDIVVSHHLPSPRSTPPEFLHSPTQPYFVANMTNYIMSVQPKLWIHGHTHAPMNYKLGETRIYCNPSGYVGEGMNPKFFDKIPIWV